MALIGPLAAANVLGYMVQMFNVKLKNNDNGFRGILALRSYMSSLAYSNPEIRASMSGQYVFTFHARPRAGTLLELITQLRGVSSPTMA